MRSHRQELFILRLCDELGIDDIDRLTQKIHRKYLEELSKEEASKVIEILLEKKSEEDDYDDEDD